MLGVEVADVLDGAGAFGQAEKAVWPAALVRLRVVLAPLGLGEWNDLAKKSERANFLFPSTFDSRLSDTAPSFRLSPRTKRVAGSCFQLVVITAPFLSASLSPIN